MMPLPQFDMTPYPPQLAAEYIDLTALWERAHAHLRPLREHLPVAGLQSGITVLARLRLKRAGWLEEPAEILYVPYGGRFLLALRELRRLAGASAEAAVAAVDARLWFAQPTFLNLEPTTRCNFKCWYCIGRHMAQADIRVEDFTRVLDHFPALKTLALVGEGEPLMHKGFFEMAAQARARGIRVMIISNGSTLSESNVRKLCEHEIAYIGISIDSADPATFAASRIDGKLEQVWRGIERLRRYRDANGYRYPKIGLKGTLFRHTRNQLPEIIAAAKAHGVEIFEGFQPLNPMRSYTRIYPAEHLAELAHVDAVAERIEQDVAAQTELVRVADFCTDEGIDLDKNGRPNRLRPNCDEQWIYTLLTGDITPCCQVKAPISPRWNLFRYDLDQILADPEYENLRFNLWNGLFPRYCEGCWKTRVSVAEPGPVCR